MGALQSLGLEPPAFELESTWLLSLLAVGVLVPSALLLSYPTEYVLSLRFFRTLHVALSCVDLDLLFKLWNPCIHQNRDVGLYSMSLLPFSTLSGSLCGIATGGSMS